MTQSLTFRAARTCAFGSVPGAIGREPPESRDPARYHANRHAARGSLARIARDPGVAPLRSTTDPEAA